MPLSPSEKTALLRLMLTSRLGDLREQSLIRQGKAMFHVSSMGHEALAVVGNQLKPMDYLCPYYRDRALVMAKGLSTRDIALEFLAKRESESRGRQMPGHFSGRKHNIWSLPSPVAANLLPACGLAWGIKMDQKDLVVVATLGDAATRQGDFYEAGSLAVEMDLPMLFIVEDNGIGISSVTEKTTPKGLRLLREEKWVILDGSDVQSIHAATRQALEHIRSGGGPVFMWCRMERISSHSSADDQRKYRDPEELATLEERCPINCLRDQMIESGELTQESYEALHREIEAQVREDYQTALKADDPDPADAPAELFAPSAPVKPLKMETGTTLRLVDAINGVFHHALETDEGFIFYGEDIADPKGGVFSLTKGLSTAFPRNVFNSPLAESTILGVACGLSCYGKKPVFEIQFIDFLWPGFNQLISNLATLRWRSNGGWNCPCVIYAPYGAYLPGGALWHSQTNESLLAHIPGLKIVIPSTPEDAAGLFWSAMQDPDPVLVLVPKHLLWKEHTLREDLKAVEIGQARIRRKGEQITVVTWGNGVELVEETLDEMEAEIRAEVIDLRSISPWDEATVVASAQKTGRLLVVQEDAEQCSIGHTIISHLMTRRDLWSSFLTPPRLLAKDNLHVGFAHAYEYGILPSKVAIQKALREMVTAKSIVHNEVSSVAVTEKGSSGISAGKVMMKAYSGADDSGLFAREERTIMVPLLGEGITNARVVSLLKQPGDTISEDESICELETDKAIFPVESEFNGTLKEWKVAEEEDVEVGQMLAVLECETQNIAPQRASSAPEAAAPSQSPAPQPRGPSEGGLGPQIVSQIKNVVPTHMTVKAEWGALRAARAEAKKQGLVVTPTMMLSWCLVQAMMKHPIFCCTVSTQDTLMSYEHFDFGFAVALENDALETAVIQKAATYDWASFVEAYTTALKAARGRQLVSKARTPLILTSMGGYRVRSALPVVVPPAIATLFVGEAHWEWDNNGSPPKEEVELCLSFDHRWLNGVAGAALLSDMRKHMQEFTLG